ncbi:hypothetical protein Q9L58_004315 [Maublancomyces gigas]|uniref:DUF1742-domain-containing protein n=1 Tax=Discina gigas TaxID=1032678 RepID=A0ABR3GLB7_9PEZI
MAVPFENLYHLRKVAENSAKPCTVCYKPTASVLVTPDKKDFFYICPGHSKDRGFATAVVDPDPTPEELEKRRKEKEEKELAEEVEKVKREYAEKQKKKGKGKDKDKGDKEKEKEKEKEEDKDKPPKEEEPVQEAKKTDEEPRIFRLHKTIFETRIRRVRQQQIAKLNQERVRSSSAFPSVPRNDLTGGAVSTIPVSVNAK